MNFQMNYFSIVSIAIVILLLLSVVAHEAVLKFLTKKQSTLWEKPDCYLRIMYLKGFFDKRSSAVAIMAEREGKFYVGLLDDSHNVFDSAEEAQDFVLKKKHS